MKIFILLLGVIFSQTVFAAEVAIFGITLGADVPAIPVCESFKSDVSETCLKNDILDNPRLWKGGSNAGGSEEYTIYLPTSDIPRYLNKNRTTFGDLTFSALDGKVENITLFTEGNSVQDDALAALTKKFGKPNNFKTIMLQNSFGAGSIGYRARWLKGDVMVIFEGISDRINFGKIEISTKKYLAREKIWEDKEKGKDL